MFPLVFLFQTECETSQQLSIAHFLLRSTDALLESSRLVETDPIDLVPPCHLLDRKKAFGERTDGEARTSGRPDDR